jgi:hypothetical protein
VSFPLFPIFLIEDEYRRRAGAGPASGGWPEYQIRLLGIVLG